MCIIKKEIQNVLQYSYVFELTLPISVENIDFSCCDRTFRVACTGNLCLGKCSVFALQSMGRTNHIFPVYTTRNVQTQLKSTVYTHNWLALCRLHTKGEVAKSLGNQARGVQPACTMTTQNSQIRLISSIALKSWLITYLSTCYW